jgi:osmoprotectant transport system ATP-binding protein
MTSTCQGAFIVELRRVSYRVDGGRELIRDITFGVRAGEVLVLLGRSGSGKTTTLKLINRLLIPTSGEVLVEGQSTLAWDAIRLRRRIGYVIQETGLFPHFTVARNIALVPSLEGWPLERRRARVEELLSLVGLGPQLAERYPHQLSGGQRQRVGVARALAADPPILLLDEPFGALDPITRADLQREFKALHARLKKTAVLVTHDLREALFLASRIALFDSGRLVGLYSPGEFLCTSDPAAVQYRAAFEPAWDSAGSIRSGGKELKV